MKKILSALFFAIVCGSNASAAVVIDNSTLPQNSSNSYGSNAGIQFVAPVDFTLGLVEILMRPVADATVTFQVFEFSAQLTNPGTLIGSKPIGLVTGIPMGGADVFPDDGITVDASDLGITLQAGNVYGLAFLSTATLASLTTGGGPAGDVVADYNTIFGGNGVGSFGYSENNEVRARITSVTAPASFGLLIGALVIAGGLRRRRAAPQ